MLRVWTKLYNAFNTGQISVLGRATRGCGGAEQQKDRNSITLSPLFTSPPPSLLSHLLSFPHVCLLSISPLLYLLPPFLKSLCTSSPITLIYSQAPSSFISSLLYPLSSIHAPCFPTSRCHLFSSVPLPLPRVVVCAVQSTKLHAYSEYFQRVWQEILKHLLFSTQRYTVKTNH